MEKNFSFAEQLDATQKRLIRAIVRLDELELELAGFGRLFAPDNLLEEHRLTKHEIEGLQELLTQPRPAFKSDED
ncbi:hypothetical protein [Candidatus Chlorohelix sp.]|uniref:hypothetical protein n=1 Tax=Candidatus Chlorohelix sp. TaxID=3139201 RepID=UPI00305BF48E